jgi:catechol 2,3-dioxygenase-like lactoylglutathione lyase family enzyme
MRTTLGPIGQIARSVSDTAASEKWYREVLGLPHLYTFGTLAFFDCGGTRLMLSQREGGAAAESILYLRVPDIGAAYEALKQRGAKFTHAPHLIHRHADGTEEWMAFFEDPDARPLALMSQQRCSERSRSRLIPRLVRREERIVSLQPGLGGGAALRIDVSQPR